MSFTVKELEAIVSSPLSSDSQKAQAQAALDKAKPAVLVSGEGKECMSIDEMMTYISNDIHGRPNPPEIAAQFKKGREQDAAFNAASAKLRAAVQKYAEDKFMDMPDSGEKNCQVWNCYLDVFRRFDFLTDGKKPEYPT